MSRPVSIGEKEVLTVVNMENFITGYPGHEHQVRAALNKVLGEEKYEFFFDKVSLWSRCIRHRRFV